MSDGPFEGEMTKKQQTNLVDLYYNTFLKPDRTPAQIDHAKMLWFVDVTGQVESYEDWIARYGKVG